MTAALMTKLLDYVLETAKEVDPRGFTLKGHDGFLKSEPDLAGLPGVDFDITSEGDHIWLRVLRLEATKPPAFPASHLAWKDAVVISDDPSGPAPRQDERVLAQLIARAQKIQTEKVEKSGDPQLLAQLPQMMVTVEQEGRRRAQAALLEYSAAWKTWAEAEKPRRKTISIYGDLFALKHLMEAQETIRPLELIWGMGVCAWNLRFEAQTDKATQSVALQYPLLSQAVEVSMDSETLAMEIRPRPVDPRVEFDAIAACKVPGSAEAERVLVKSLGDVAKDGTKSPPNPFDVSTTEHLLKVAAGMLDEKGRFDDTLLRFPEPAEHLVVSNHWVLLSRPRPSNYLLDDVERLKRNVAQGVTIPQGPAALVTPPSTEPLKFTSVRYRGRSGYSTHFSGAGGGFAGGLSGTAGAVPTEVRELYFPLPYNREQVTIIEQLERSEGVAVQGPPGTGKTHTIANIICHYLAQGKKVLVTSKGEQALEVLQSKIPQAVRPLTVALLSGDRQGLEQFRASIEAIQHNISQLKEDQVQEKLHHLQASIDRAHGELERLDARVNEIAQTQLSDIVVDGVPMRAQRMAELVLQGHERYGWFDDELDLRPEHAPPLSAEQTAALREARRRLGTDIQYVDAKTPAVASLLPPERLEKLHRTLVDIRELERKESTGNLLPLRASSAQVLADAEMLLRQLEEAQALALELETTGEMWTEELRRKCSQAAFASEREALEALVAEVEQLVKARAAFLKRPVEMPEEALTSADVRKALDRAAQTGQPFGFLSMGQGAAKAHVAAIRVSGVPPQKPEDWAHVVSHVELHTKVLSFSVRWNQFASTLSVPQVKPNVTALRSIEQVTVLALKAHRLATAYDAKLPMLAEKVFFKAPLSHVRGSSHQMEEVRGHLRSHLMKEELSRATTDMAILQEKLAGTTGPISQELRAFVEKDLGRSDLAPERAVSRYVDLLAELKRVESLGQAIALVHRCSDAVRHAGALRLAERLRTIPAPAQGDDPVWPNSWREAWNWSRIRHHLDAIESRAELRELSGKRQQLENALSRFYEEIVSNAAWLSTKRLANPATLSALEIYRTAVSRIGQGTGPNATRHRRDAQNAMTRAQAAVPCWIMSHAKVSETLPAELGAFHLVIVDEASQSDIWGLLPILRGKKILVVGDDKQVSPGPGFVSSSQVNTLLARFLADQPFKEALTPGSSLYDLAATVFAGNKVMLTEHFRCVPPIIAYSNRFYEGAIQPLRIPTAQERLDPPLVDVYIETGVRTKKDINRQEAEFILAEIKAILEDPEMEDRTLGVVSMLGLEQAKYIDDLVRSKLDSKELIARKFECGDARLFQGSERDIMFLSLVVDKDNCHAVSQLMHQQRFNVAASRARDRMYLVRSVKMSDLSPVDLRRGLLEHFSKPLDGMGQDAKPLLEMCDSGFEREVYQRLHDLGYRVLPQVKSGRYSIDLVVEGEGNARLAIELDGDDFHGPERWQDDMARQRVLERAGWTFWRCFASTWAMHKEAVFEELLSRLKTMGIEPLGALERIPSLVDYRVWPPAPPKAVAAESAEGQEGTNAAGEELNINIVRGEPEDPRTALVDSVAGLEEVDELLTPQGAVRDLFSDAPQDSAGAAPYRGPAHLKPLSPERAARVQKLVEAAKLTLERTPAKPADKAAGRAAGKAADKTEGGDADLPREMPPRKGRS